MSTTTDITDHKPAEMPLSVRPGDQAGIELSRQPLDPKQLRTEHVGNLLAHAYEKASQLKLSKDELKQLREEFSDEAIEIKREELKKNGVPTGKVLETYYISHMELRERLWDVFGPGQVSEICRERSIRQDSNEIAVDLVLMIRGVFVAEGIGTAKYYPNNPKGSFGDTVESAWSDALRRCCKKFGVGTQVWRPQFIRDFKERHFAQREKKAETERTKPSKGKTVDPDWPEVGQ